MKTAFYEIFEMKIGAKKKCMCAEFGAKMFVWARDTAVNVMYYAMGGSGSFLRRESYRTP